MSKRRRKQELMGLYKQAVDQCCNPDCSFGYGLETHHIIPIAKDGLDEFVNYIILCAGCHKIRGIHSRYSKTQIELLTYKFYIEKMRFGCCSDDVDYEVFKGILKKYVNFKKSVKANDKN